MLKMSQLTKQVEKFLDTTTICPNRLAQKAALFGLQNLEKFIAEEKLMFAQT